MQAQQFALVTGAAHRVGFMIAQHLAKRNFAVYLHYFSSTDQAHQAEQTLKKNGFQAQATQADLTDPQQIAAMFARIPTSLDIVINAAAVMRRMDFQSVSVAEWDATLNLNLRAPFLVAQHAAKRMPAGGLIVNISDVGAQKVWSGFPVYSISKAGLDSMTRLLAKSLAPDIRVNAIAPGLVLPSDDVAPEEWDRLIQRLPVPRPARPAEITSTLDLLIDNPYLTGQVFTVDGGYSLI